MRRWPWVMRWRWCTAPAIGLADRGFVLEQGDVDIFGTATEAFRKDAPSAAIFLKKGEPFQVGDRFVQKDLANTLRRIARQGAAGFYQGPVAAAIVASSRAGGGILAQ